MGQRDCTGLDMTAEDYFELGVPMNFSTTGKGDSRVFHCWNSCKCKDMQEEISNSLEEMNNSKEVK